MINQLRADYYKLFHSKLFYVICASFILSFTAFTAMALGKNIFSMGSVVGHKNGIPLIDGFIGFSYKNLGKPNFWELAYSATAFNGLLWFILMALSIQFISKEYQEGTIKLEVAYGIDIFKVYVSKSIVVISFFEAMLCIFNFAAFAVVSIIEHYTPSFANIISFIGLILLYCLIFSVFALICFTLYIAIKNTVLISTIMPVFMFSTIVIYIMYGFKQPLWVQCYVKINPFSYMSNASRFWADPAISRNILLYFFISVPILLISSYFILKHQEIK